MNETSGIKKVVYKPIVLFYWIFIAPIVVTGFTFFFYYKNKHNIPGRLPTISTAASLLPESRIFAMGIIICCWLLFAGYIILDRTLKLLTKMKHIAKAPLVQLTHYATGIACGLSFFSLVGLCSVNIKSNEVFHTLCAVCFVFSISVTFVLIDYQIMRSGPSNYMFNTLCTLCIPVLAMIGALVTKFSTNDNVYNFGVILEYISSFMIPFKFVLIAHSIPPFNIEVTQKDTKVD